MRGILRRELPERYIGRDLDPVDDREDDRRRADEDVPSELLWHHSHLEGWAAGMGYLTPEPGGDAVVQLPASDSQGEVQPDFRMRRNGLVELRGIEPLTSAVRLHEYLQKMPETPRLQQRFAPD